MTHDPSPYANELLNDFASWLSEQSISASTVLAYCGDVRAVLAALGAGGAPVRVTELEPNIVSLQLVWDYQSGQTGATTARRRSTAMRRFFQFLQEAGHCPAGATPRPLKLTNESALHTSVDFVSIGQVLDAPDPRTLNGRRDIALLWVLFDTGIQVKELCALCVADWSSAQQQLSVGAGNRRRPVHLSVAGSRVDEYLQALGEPEPDWPLFPSRSGAPLNSRDVTRIVKKQAKALGLPPGAVTPQSIIAAGRILAINLSPDRAVQELGYARLSAAKRRYAGPATEAHSPPGSGPATVAAPCLRPRPVDATDEDARWLASARRRGQPSSHHGFPPPAPRGAPTRHWALLPDNHPPIRLHLDAVGYALRPLLAETERRARNRRGQEQQADPAQIVALRECLLEADHGLYMHAWYLASEMESPGRTRAVLALVQQAMDPDANDETVMARVDKELERRERVRKERADAVLESRPPAASADNPRETLLQLDLLSGALMFAAEFLGRMIGTGNGWEAFAWLFDGLWPLIRRLRKCATQYYGIPEAVHREDAIQGALALSMVAAVVRTSPEALRNAAMGVPLASLVVPYFEQVFAETLALVLQATSGILPLWHKVEDIGHRGRFIRDFEREWEQVLPFTDGRFGFAVVPRLSVDALRRYLDTVSWSAGGQRGAIRHEVADYLVHRGIGIGEAIRAQLPGLWQDRVWSVLAPVMEPLVQAQTRKIERVCPELGVPGLAVSLRSRLRELVEEYDPHRRFRDGKGGVARGAIGAGRREDVARAAAALGVAEWERPLPLVSYLERELKRHVRRMISEELDLIDNASIPQVQGPDGKDYMTVRGAKKWLECSDEQVRRLDDVLHPRRLGELWPTGTPRLYRHLPADTRLYEVDVTPWDQARARLQRWARRAPALPSGYKIRAQVARELGVESSALVLWEKRGHIKPTKRGRNVLYSPDDTARVRKLELMRRKAREDPLGE